jgi:hypothetical protein
MIVQRKYDGEILTFRDIRDEVEFICSHIIRQKSADKYGYNLPALVFCQP